VEELEVCIASGLAAGLEVAAGACWGWEGAGVGFRAGPLEEDEDVEVSELSESFLGTAGAAGVVLGATAGVGLAGAVVAGAAFGRATDDEEVEEVEVELEDDCFFA